MRFPLLKPFTSFLQKPQGTLALRIGASVLAGGLVVASYYMTNPALQGIALALLGGGCVAGVWRLSGGSCSQKNPLGEETLCALFQDTPQLLHYEDGEGRILQVNKQWLRKTGYSKAEVIGKKFSDFLDDSSRGYFGWMLPAELELRGAYNDEHCVLRAKSGTLMPLQVSACAEFDADGNLCNVAVALIDASSALAIQAALDAQHKLNHAVMDALGTAVVVADAHDCVTYANPAACRLVECEEKTLLHRKLSDCLTLVDQDTGNAISLEEAAQTKDAQNSANLGRVMVQSFTGNRVPVRGSLAEYTDPSGKDGGRVLVLQDVSESLRMTNQLLELSQTDALTGLPNRTVLKERLRSACVDAQPFFDGFAVLFLDLDRFKNINDSMGHPVGDELLKAVTSRLKTVLRENDLICRMGGDEFVVLLDAPVKREAVTAVASKIVEALASPFELSEGTLTLSTSVGIAMYPDAGTDADTLLKHADIAMYRAKREGRSRYEFFCKELDTPATTRLQLESALRSAIAQGDIVPHYQPQLCATTGRVLGVEALARWTNRDGYIGPDVFLPLAEECGLVGALGLAILEKAVGQMRVWLDKGYQVQRLGVNVSPLQLSLPGFVDQVESVLRRANLPAHHLELEITESALISRPEVALDVLTRLKKLGVRIALDDFGTGYSSLSYLKKFPVDTLKIDRSFVRDLSTDSEGRKIVSAITGLAQSLDMEVVAEGVETQDQYELLRGMHCGVLQGYLFGKPCSADQVDTALSPKSLHSVVPFRPKRYA